MNNFARETYDKLLAPLLCLCAMVAVGALSAYIGAYGFSYQVLIALLGAVSGIVIVLAGRRGLQIGLFLLTLLLALGYRTIRLTPGFSLHPAEIVIWGLFALLLMQRAVTLDQPLDLWLPRWALLLIPFWFWGWWIGISAGRAADLMFGEFRDFLLLIPLTVVATAVLKDSAQWVRLLLGFYIAATWIAVWGVIEYLFPNFVHLFPSFISNATPFLTAENFARARFSFWGSPAATFVCVLAVPFTIVLWSRSSFLWQRALIVVALTLQVFAIYIGGYRSMWMLLGLAVMVWALLRYGPVLTGVLLVLWLGIYQLLPDTAHQRTGTLLAILYGQPGDSSGEKRWERAIGALDVAWHNPLGVGWAGAGWVHSDFIQLAANLGLLAGAIFLGAYSLTIWRMWKLWRSRTALDATSELSLALLLSFGVTGGILAMEGVQVLPQLVLPIWIVWVLVEIWLRQHGNRPKSSPNRVVEEYMS